MKKYIVIIIFLMTFLSINTISAQNKFEDCANSGFYCGGSFGKFATRVIDQLNGLSPTQYNIKNIITDDKNFYVFQKVSLLSGEQASAGQILSEDYNAWGYWKSAKITGRSQIMITNGEVKTTDNNGELLLTFHNGMPLDNLYDKSTVKKAFEDALAKMSARGAEGTEVFYAEFPRIGTNINLVIVLGSEIIKNNGVPKWKMEVGKLVFDKVKSKFNFVKSK